MKEAKSPSAAPCPEGGTRVRDRIFRTARELFYRQGIRAVGVDAIACGAGTNKMSFYRSFGSKDELVAECLRAQVSEFWEHWDASIAPHAGDPRRQIETVFESSMSKSCGADACGCPLSNAAVELREAEHPGHQVIREYKAEVRRRLRALARDAGASDAEALGDALMLLLEGSAMTRLTFAGNGGPIVNSLGAVHTLLDAYLPARKAAAAAKAAKPAKSARLAKATS
ncbi:TetR/AcrR family transcriptional regulator [Solimonas terrae]|uniref:TetR/AcrR family transcriptional regulator n=1 Tax=Solimonas terrae TaxID=1396819 RepID=A0A6M2BRV4_9GAMM|nr:TetR/AcrR family transcriptional regulator [Solimonas terrae]NGY05218.1 TetR/AcrR family transcriptional regulator [Solimonas terrae]